MGSSRLVRASKRRLLRVALLGCLALAGGCANSSDPSDPVDLASSAAEEPGEDRSAAPGDAAAAPADRRETPPPDAGTSAEPAAAKAASDEEAGFTRERLEQLVAPVALYPDQLLMQVLMAATYPAEVAEAGAWRKSNPSLNGKALDDAIADKGWDVSVNSLVHATQALDLMVADPSWTQDLGDAFLAQQDDVLNAVQVMRNRACDLGNLKTNDRQQVIFENASSQGSSSPAPPSGNYQEGNAPAPLGRSGQQQYAEPYGQAPDGGAQPYGAQPYGAQPYATNQPWGQPYGYAQAGGVFVVPPPPRIVRIAPLQAGFLHVPVYNPRVMFGPPPPRIFYPQVMAFPQATVGVAPILSFGVGLAVGNLIWGDIDWDRRHVYRRRYGSGFYGSDRGWYLDERNWRDSMWRHDERHRRGISYMRPEFGDLWRYRERRDERVWRDWDKQGRRQDDRWRKEDEKRWREQAKVLRRDDDRRSKDDEKRWRELDKRAGKDDDRWRKEQERNRKEQDKQFRREDDRRSMPAPDRGHAMRPDKGPPPPRGGGISKGPAPSRGGGDSKGPPPPRGGGISKGGDSPKGGGPSPKGGGSSRGGGAPPKGSSSSKGGKDKHDRR
jgi:hypothetical protein